MCYRHPAAQSSQFGCGNIDGLRLGWHIGSVRMLSSSTSGICRVVLTGVHLDNQSLTG